MPNIKDVTRLTKRAMLTNLFIGRKADGSMTKNSTYISVLLSGTHGAGKSAVASIVAKELGGYSEVIEVSAVKEGEVPGIPTIQNLDGKKNVEFVKHHIIQKIADLEEFYYNNALKGFSCAKLNNDGSVEYKRDGKSFKIEAPTAEDKVEAGSQNRYKFGENLPTEIKLELLRNGEIKPFILSFDEMNRCNNEVMKEFMNIVLTKVINGYKLPWWVFILSSMNPCDQDSLYSTNDLDAAQLDRFLKIKLTPDAECWVDYAIDMDLPGDYVAAFSALDGKLQATTGVGYDDTSRDAMKPSHRDHTLCAYIYGYRQEVSDSGFFTAEDKMQEEDDVRALLIGKLGESAGQAVFANLKNTNNYIDPALVLSGESDKLNSRIKDKISSMKPAAKRVLLDSIIRYVSTTGVKTYYDITLMKSDAAKSGAAKKTWANMMAQLSELIRGDKTMQLIDPSYQVYFARQALQKKVDISDPKYKKFNGSEFFYLLAPSFSADVIATVGMTSKLSSSGELDKQ